jgi:alpha-amylase/alpha-mannosidase (GH57 family)
MSKYVLIHGHFYQPPRENPWNGKIPLQKSALPFHDWNERIHKECYEPNSRSRILDSDGRILSLVNNYSYLSFNIGPTLMDWIRSQSPQTYIRIKEADYISTKKLNGHGNGIAQVYNHLIMPLASQRDQITQIEWGIADFEFHFHRKPEAMWLGETAINQEVAVNLMNTGIKYVILAPQQASKVRSFDGEWTSVQADSIDTSKAYRVFDKDSKGKIISEKYLDILFYNGPLSTAVSFEGVLKNSQHFYDKIKSNFKKENDIPEIITIATDGESYGHHEPYGDMCLAYLFEKLLPENNIECVNGAWFLENHPPQDEVELTNTFAEGSAWSCAHGVGRWYRDCGCATGGEANWNQKWRGPLRNGFNQLKDALDDLFIKECLSLKVKHPWKLRNEYIQVMLGADSSEDWASGKVKKNRVSKLLSLLEMQKYAMYMFTSCGWFFNDIEGLEPLQNMQYAQMALDLAEGISPSFRGREDLMKVFGEIISNENKKSGVELFSQASKGEFMPEYLAVAPYLFDQEHNHSSFCVQSPPYSIEAELIQTQQNCQYWKIVLEHSETFNRSMVWVLTFGVNEPLLFCDNPIEIPKVLPETQKAQFQYFIKKCEGQPISLHDLWPEDLDQLMHGHIRGAFESLGQRILNFPEEQNFLLELVKQNDSPLPNTILAALRHSINARVYTAANAFLADPDAIQLHSLILQVKNAEEYNVDLELPTIKIRFETELLKTISEITSDLQDEALEKIIYLIEAADALKIQIDKTEIENKAFSIFEQLKKSELSPLHAKFFTWLNFSLREINVR